MKILGKILLTIIVILGIYAIVYFSVPAVKDWTDTNIFKIEQVQDADNNTEEPPLADDIGQDTNPGTGLGTEEEWN